MWTDTYNTQKFILLFIRLAKWQEKTKKNVSHCSNPLETRPLKVYSLHDNENKVDPGSTPEKNLACPKLVLLKFYSKVVVKV